MMNKQSWRSMEEMTCRHQMDVDFFADFHLCNGCIEAADHLAHTEIGRAHV